MDFLGDILSLGGAALTGGMTGLIGVGLKALFGWLGEREKARQQKIQNDHELALLDRQLAARGQELESERQIAAEGTRQASYDYANVRQEVYKWVASLVTLMRPAITLYLLIVTTIIAFELMGGKAIPYVDAKTILKEYSTMLVYLTSTAVTWWFGDRPPQAARPR
jgi:hypothetical protein